MRVLLLAAFFSLFNPVYSQYWFSVGTGMSPGAVYSLVRHNNEMYAAGHFDSVGLVPANNIAKWNGSNWSSLGSGVPGSIYTQVIFNNELYAGGFFDTANGSIANYLAKWDGTNWIGVGGGFNNAVHSLCVYNGELYAGGVFSMAGGDTAWHIAKWNGTTWSPVGSGMNGPVIAMTVFNGELFAGGNFYFAGGQPANFIAKWNGINWTPIGGGMDNAVLAFEVSGNTLYAGGWFSMADTVPAMQVAKWDGNNWSSLGSGISGGYLGYGVQVLAMHNGSLYAGGEFDMAGGITVSNIARWDGSNWNSPGNGVDHFSFALAEMDTGLYVGGIFSTVNQGIPANRMAKWVDTCAVAPGQPGAILGNDSVCTGSTQTYFINTVNGTSSYTWTFPQGWTGTSTSNSITVTAGQSNGIISVVANNSCGTGIPQHLPVIVKFSPQQPGIISGLSTVCAGDTLIYSVNPVPGALSYLWTLPAGWSGNSITNSITVIAGFSGGTISVKANNECGISPERSLFVTFDIIPPAPVLINGNSQVCLNTIQNYSVTVVPGATNYSWSLPPGWTGNSTTNIISVTAGSTDGLLSVTAGNVCGNSSPTLLPVTVKFIPSKPDEITGSAYVCIGNLLSYSITPVNGATNYNWVLPQGWSGNSGNTSIAVTAGSSSGDIMVSANNECGNSDYAVLSITIDPIPGKPELIEGNTFVNMGESHHYWVNSVTGATSYEWFVQGGTVSFSQNDATVNWKDAGIQKLFVRAKNHCGSGQESELTINVAAPDAKDPFEIRVAPNPTTGVFYLLGKRLQEKTIRLEIWSMTGQLLQRGTEVKGSNNYSRLINIDKLSRGNYLVKIFIDDHAYTRTIIKLP